MGAFLFVSFALSFLPFTLTRHDVAFQDGLDVVGGRVAVLGEGVHL
jgi:hypothetical protein